MKGEIAGIQKKRAGKAINWLDVHARLETAQITLERASAPTAEQVRAILKQRARVLAQEPETVSTAHEHLELVEFMLAYERYGIESANVREVYPLTELVPLPGTPGFVLGLVNVRGQILSVIDLKKFFGLPEKGLTDLNKIIIIQNAKMEYGILADVIAGVRKVSANDIQPAVTALTGTSSDYIRGVTSERLIVLDATRLLTDKRIIVQEEAV